MNRPRLRLANQPLVDVLIIDDSEVAGEAMAEILRAAGMSATAISSPIGATQATLRREAQLVIVDMNMPSLQGDKLVALLRGVDRLAEVKLVLASAEETPTLRRAAKAAGADGVYRKSDGPGALVALARNLLGRRPTSGVQRRDD